MRREVFIVSLLGLVAAACGGGGGGGATAAPSSNSSSGPARGDDMSAKQLAAIRTIEEAFDTGDAKKYASVMTENVTVNLAGKPDIHGRPAAEASFGHVKATFGKVDYRVRRVFTKGDVAIVEWSMSGTHEGPLQGVAPTHVKVGWNGAEVDRFTNEGKIRERHVYFDAATPLAQIGKRPGEVRGIPERSGPMEHIAATGAKEEEGNVALLDRINRAWQTRDEAKWSELLTDDAEWDDFALAKPSKGRDALKAYFRIFANAFPSITSNTIDAWGVGAFVIEEGSYSGVHKGPYMDLPASGRVAALYELNIVEIASGKLRRGWTYSNELDMREQLAPLPGATSAKPAPSKPKK